MLHIRTEDYCYYVFIESDRHPGNRWSLWIPECVIYDTDLERSWDVTQTNVAERENVIRIDGRAEDEESRATVFSIRLEALGDDLHMDLRVTNAGILPWGPYANLAVSLVHEACPDFFDQDGRHTWLVQEDGQLVRLADRMDVRKGNRFHHFALLGRGDVTDKEQRFFVSSGYIARTSHDGKTSVGMAWNPAGRVDANFYELSDIHSHPAIGPLAPGQQCEARGLVRIADVPPDQLLAQVQERLR